MKQNIAIIGAGPSGCAAAKSLLLSHSSACSSPLNFAIQLFYCDKNKIKIGETIPPAAAPILHQLELSHLLEREKKCLNEHFSVANHYTRTQQCLHLPCPGSISLWGSNQPGYNDFYFNPEGKGYHLNRCLFERDLIKNIQQTTNKKDVSFYHHHRLTSISTFERNSGRKQFKLNFLVDGVEQKSFVADFVVDASGAASVFTRKIGVAKNTLDEVLSLSVIIDCPIISNIGNYTLVEAVDNGWWYAARLPENKLIISFCSDQSVIKSQSLQDVTNWLQALNHTQLLKKKINLEKIKSHLTIHPRVATSTILSRVTGDNWLAVGDAASSYDSISSAGITKALQNGLDAGKAIFELIENDNKKAVLDYEKKIFNAFTQYLSLRHDIYRSETRFQSSPFWLHRRGII
ncbi:NAD(P)/FAD-dependent oxidoreductase [Aliikangiella sp. IMCC44359]|uniref:NAD(P)/FAD-dependent oxidoreductase n=1 Tax=Aliikangiella sp. IMCC44359 TaxID=3459125 RepID=UPI00403AD9EE